MKRIWFTQQKPFDYIPLRLGLGYLTTKQAQEEAERINMPMGKRNSYDITRPALVSKIYTTRKRRLSGKYYVVEGSRYKAKPVEPRIEFEAHPVAMINFTENNIFFGWLNVDEEKPPNIPELDLGLIGVTWKDLLDELLRLNKKTTTDTLFFINKMERINSD